MKAAKVEHIKHVLAAPWLKSVIAILVALALWRLVDAGITKFYARRFVSRFIPRVPTYASLTKSLSSAVILFFLIVELLNIWNVNVAPALWSATVVSVVIGFGAQALVRDVLTGVFHLFEDAYDVGDGVELTTTNGVIAGVVESVGVRETRIIDARGQLISVPYGSIVLVANTTRRPQRLSIKVSLPLSAGVAAIREKIAGVAEAAARSVGVAPEGIAVRLADVTPDSAAFRIEFEASRANALAAEATLRERVVAVLQADGLLPGGAGAGPAPSAARANPAASAADPNPGAPPSES